MPEKASTLVSVNNSIYERINNFNNTFTEQFMILKDNLIALNNELKTVGYVNGVIDALDDIANHFVGQDATIINTNYNKTKELFVVLNTYKPTDPVATQMEAIKNSVIKIREIVINLDKV